MTKKKKKKGAAGKKDDLKELSKSKRIELARERVSRVLDHLLYVIELHANNEFVVYSNTLSAQIRRSYAANAFLAFQSSMYQIEVVRLCALWDGVEHPKENIPTVIELVNDDEIIETLGDVSLRHWPDPHDREYAEGHAAKAKADLRKAIKDGRAIIGSARLKSVMNARNKHIAHSLVITRQEKEKGPIAPMKRGDETALFEASISIVEALYRVITDKGFMMDHASERGQRNAAALWNGCKFDVLR